MNTILITKSAKKNIIGSLSASLFLQNFTDILGGEDRARQDLTSSPRIEKFNQELKEKKLNFQEKRCIRTYVRYGTFLYLLIPKVPYRTDGNATVKYPLTGTYIFMFEEYYAF